MRCVIQQQPKPTQFTLTSVVLFTVINVQSYDMQTHVGRASVNYISTVCIAQAFTVRTDRQTDRLTQTHRN